MSKPPPASDLAAIRARVNTPVFVTLHEGIVRDYPEGGVSPRSYVQPGTVSYDILLGDTRITSDSLGMGAQDVTLLVHALMQSLWDSKELLRLLDEQAAVPDNPVYLP